MNVLEHSGPTCNRCGVTYVPEGEGQTCGEPYCNGRVTWEATADRLANQLRAAVARGDWFRQAWANANGCSVDEAERAYETLGDITTPRGGQ